MKKTTASHPVGTLYVVSTPIGNVDDITLRALKVLRECDYIVCEEAKEALRLLRSYEIDKEIIELNEHNDAEASVECMKHLKEGKSLALISDAGTPLLADPGDILVQAAVKYNCDVRVLPGASSLLTALVRSTLPSRQFVYVGFLSRKNAERDAEIKALSREHRTMIVMDTPYRIRTILSALADAMPNRRAYVGCNLTMTNEAHYYGTLTELENNFSEQKFRGEYVIVIEGSDEVFDSHSSVSMVQAEVPEVGRNGTGSNGSHRKPVSQITEYAHGVHEPHTDEVPLPESDENQIAIASMDDYIPVHQHPDPPGSHEHHSDDSSGNRNRNGSGGRDGNREKNWNNNSRRWNNKKRWDGGKRQNHGTHDRRDWSAQRPDAEPEDGSSFSPNSRHENSGNREQGGRRHSFNHRHPRGDRNRTSYRNNRHDRDGHHHRDHHRDTQPADNGSAMYDESYDRRENFGNREGANYSSFDHASRESFGNRTSRHRNHRGNRSHNHRSGHDRSGNADGNRRSDNPVYNHLNELPPKRRRW